MRTSFVPALLSVAFGAFAGAATAAPVSYEIDIHAKPGGDLHVADLDPSDRRGRRT